MALSRGEAGDTMLLDEVGHFLLLDLALLDAQGGDHLVVGLGHVTSASRLGDVGVLHLGREAVDVVSRKTQLLERIVGEALDNGLRSRAGTDRVATDSLEVNLGIHAVIGRQDDAEAAEHVLEDRHALLDVALSVHAELGSAATSGDSDALIGASLDEGSSLDQSVRRACAEAASVGTGGVAQTSDLGSCLGEVAAATLQDVAASLFGAVDDVLDVALGNARGIHGRQQSQDRGSLGNDVLEHRVSRKVDVDFVSALDATHDFASHEQRLGSFVFDSVLDGVELHAVLYAFNEILGDDLVGSEGVLGCGNKAGLEVNEVEHVGHLHEQIEFVLRHHLTELTVTIVHVASLVKPGEFNFLELIGGLVANVNLVGPVLQHLIPRADVLRERLEILALGIDHALGGLSGAVFDHHVGGVDQHVAGAFDNAFHVYLHIHWNRQLEQKVNWKNIIREHLGTGLRFLIRKMRCTLHILPYLK